MKILFFAILGIFVLSIFSGAATAFSFGNFGHGQNWNNTTSNITQNITHNMNKHTEIMKSMRNKTNEYMKQNLGHRLHDYLTSKALRNEMKQKIKQCRENQSEECKNIRQVGIMISKGVLENVINNTIDRLNDAKEKILQHPKLTDEEKQTIIARIDETISRLQTLYNKIESANTKQEIINAVKDYRKIKHVFKVKSKISIEMLKQRKIGLIIERAKHLEGRLNKLMESCNNTNVTQDLENKTAEFESKINEARVLYNESQTKWAEIRDLMSTNENKTAGQLVKQAQDLMQQAQMKLKEASLVLKDMIRDVRMCKQSKPKINETENENETQHNENNETQINETINETNETGE